MLPEEVALVTPTQQAVGLRQGDVGLPWELEPHKLWQIGYIDIQCTVLSARGISILVIVRSTFYCRSRIIYRTKHKKYSIKVV